MNGRKVIPTITALLAILFSPVLLAVLLGTGAILFIVLAAVLCPGFSARVSSDCGDCHSQVCPMALMLIMFVVFPLGIASVYLIKRRGNLRHRCYRTAVPNKAVQVTAR